MPKSTKTNTIKAEDLYRFQLPRTPEISPDGNWVVYSVMRVDRKSESKFSNLWLAGTSKGKPRQFTYGDHRDTNPAWSPDGKTIAFLSDRPGGGNHAQIYLIPFDGGEARKLTDIEGDIEWFKWSPDGKQLLCAVQKLDPEERQRQKDQRKRRLGVVDRRYTRVYYKQDGQGFRRQERTHLWTVNTRTGRAKQITDHAIFDEADATWSPDGTRIALISNRSKDPDLADNEDSLYTIPAEGGRFRKIDGTIGYKFYPSYSPDGKWIAYFGAQGKGDWWKNTQLWVVPAGGRADPRSLTAKFDLSVEADTLNDVGGLAICPPTWSPDGKRLYFIADRHGSTHIYSIDFEGEDLQQHTEGNACFGSFTLDRSGTKAAVFRGDMQDPGQIWQLDLENGALRQLTRLNAWLQRLDLGTVEEVWFKGPDKNDLQGWILLPPGFDARKKYPSILEIHGGPLAQYGNFFMHEFYYLAAQGYVVYFSNPRGGSGYGEEHARAIWNAWGTVDFDDLMSWTDFVAKKPYIDKKRMGVTGGSYGGYMTLWIIGHTNRFKAAVAQRVLSNFISMWGTSDFNWGFQQVIGDKPPYADVMNAWDRSPMKHIGNARTPTMIIHSENDHRTPIEQGEQAFVALKTLGVPTEFIRFPGEPHGLSRTGRTDRRIRRLNHILRWMDMYLK